MVHVSPTRCRLGLFLTVALAFSSLILPTASGVTTGGLEVATVSHFPGAFVPGQVVATPGHAWLVGTTTPGIFTHCDLDDVNAATLMQRLVAIPACAIDVTAAATDVYMLVEEGQQQPNTWQMHVERFDVRTRAAEILSPVVMSIVGSGVAHTDFRYGDGSLWLYGTDARAGAEVVQISPATGAVVSVVQPVPQIGGIYPSVAVHAGNVWMAGGPGGSRLLMARVSGSAATRVVFTGPRNSAVLWVSSDDGELWAAVADYGTGTRPTLRIHLLTGHGKRVLWSGPVESVGLFAPVSTPDGRLWTLAYPARCTGTETLLAVDPKTAVSHVALRLAASPSACNDEDSGAQVAGEGRNVFALVPVAREGASVLYRAST